MKIKNLLFNEQQWAYITLCQKAKGIIQSGGQLSAKQTEKLNNLYKTLQEQNKQSIKIENFKSILKKTRQGYEIDHNKTIRQTNNCQECKYSLITGNCVKKICIKGEDHEKIN